MSELRVYIETSVWSHVFHDDTPDFQRATVEFLNQAGERIFAPYISTVVLDEVARANPKRREGLLGEIAAIRPTLLRGSVEADTLARRYVEAGVLPPADEVDTVEQAQANLCEAVELFLETASDVEVAERLHPEVYVTRIEVAGG